MVLFFIYTLLVSYLSLSPIDSESMPHIWDKAAHTIAYIGFALLCFLVSSNNKQLLTLLILCFFYGITIELLQGLTEYRFASWQDQIANTVGLLLGYVTAKMISYFVPKSRIIGF